MTKKTLGSIVVFNPKIAVLRTTIQSFLDASSNGHIVIWDNSPVDNISSVLKQEFVKNVDYFKSPGNWGYGRGHNEVFKKSAAGFDYFCILNPDLEIPKNSLKILEDYLISHPEKGLVTGIIQGDDGQIHEVHKLLPSFASYIKSLVYRFLKIEQQPQSLVKDHAYGGPFELPILSGCFMFFTSNHYKELNGFDDRFFLYFEDYDLSLRSFLQGKSKILPESKIIHKWARESHRNWKLFRVHLESGLKFYAKWGLSSKLANKVNKPIG